MLDLDDAVAEILSGVRRLDGVEEVDVGACDGRVLVQPLVASVDVPGFDNSAMDGYALRHDDVTGRSDRRLNVTQRILAGDTPGPLPPGEAARIFTGAPLPPGADTVVMQEECERVGDTICLARGVARGDHVRPRGHDFTRGDTLLAAGHRVRPQDVAIAAATGAVRLTVARKPRVAVFATGDELVLPGRPLATGSRYTANNQLLCALGARAGCAVTDAGIVPDSPEATRDTLISLAESHDLVVSSGGASVGEADHLQAVLEAVGEIRFWRIAVRPGKPVLFGRVAETAVLGLPGNPVSCFVTFLLLVKPLVLAMQGAPYVPPRRLSVRADFKWPQPGTRREFVRGRLDREGRTVALYRNQSSDVLSSTVWADGLVDIAPNSVIANGDPVAYLPFSGLLDG